MGLRKIAELSDERLTDLGLAKNIAAAIEATTKTALREHPGVRLETCEWRRGATSRMWELYAPGGEADGG